MAEKVFLSVVIPAYNEEENIASTLSEISEHLKGKDFSYEVVLADDGSTDDTLGKARSFEDRLAAFRTIESSPNRGKGYVLRKAMLKADGDYVLFMDADNSTSIRELDKFLPYFGGGYDIFIASRRIPGAEVEVPVRRKLMGNVYIFLAKAILGIRVSDINCGFKVFRRKVAGDVFSRQTMNDWSFDAEILYLCKKRGYRVKEVSVKWVHKDTSKVKPFRDAFRSFMGLMKIKMNALNGRYGKS
ncbi:MAG: dolichyl-phosphate beta-glucosyltransferase [Candidatus Omnitrophota bacterium]|nr:dolichyl-phosphate beta-glucosyltransferase [Candidatus Omnitrophota bacterium]